MRPAAPQFLCVRSGRVKRRSASLSFTLIEVVVAIAASAVLLAALATTFHTVLALREDTGVGAQQELRRDRFRRFFLDDVLSMAPPSGVLEGAVTGTKEEDASVRRDRLTFYATSGSVRDGQPWGDVTRVEYYLEAPDEQSDESDKSDWSDRSDRSDGYCLVRAVTRNLLAIVEQEPEKQKILERVVSLELTYYDGEQWRDSWDSTTEDNQAPLAVAARVEFAPDPATPSPLVRIVAPVVARAAAQS